MNQHSSKRQAGHSKWKLLLLNFFFVIMVLVGNECFASTLDLTNTFLAKVSSPSVSKDILVINVPTSNDPFLKLINIFLMKIKEYWRSGIETLTGMQHLFFYNKMFVNGGSALESSFWLPFQVSDPYGHIMARSISVILYVYSQIKSLHAVLVPCKIIESDISPQLSFCGHFSVFNKSSGRCPQAESKKGQQSGNNSERNGSSSRPPFIYSVLGFVVFFLGGLLLSKIGWNYFDKRRRFIGTTLIGISLLICLRSLIILIFC